MRKQYYLRPSHGRFTAWDVDRLVRLTKDFPPIRVPLEAIREIDEPHWFSGGAQEATCRAVMEHARMINEADLPLPYYPVFRWPGHGWNASRPQSGAQRMAEH